MSSGVFDVKRENSGGQCRCLREFHCSVLEYVRELRTADDQSRGPDVYPQHEISASHRRGEHDIQENYLLVHSSLDVDKAQDKSRQSHLDAQGLRLRGGGLGNTNEADGPKMTNNAALRLGSSTLSHGAEITELEASRRIAAQSALQASLEV